MASSGGSMRERAHGCVTDIHIQSGWTGSVRQCRCSGARFMTWELAAHLKARQLPVNATRFSVFCRWDIHIIYFHISLRFGITVLVDRPLKKIKKYCSVGCGNIMRNIRQRLWWILKRECVLSHVNVSAEIETCLLSEMGMCQLKLEFVLWNEND